CGAFLDRRGVTSACAHLPPVRRPVRGRSMTMEQGLALMHAAGQVRSRARAGTLGEPLRGRHLALMHAMTDTRPNTALKCAASLLGARVADLQFSGLDHRESRLQAWGRMLGQMYDAVDCGTLATDIVRRIEDAAGVPVYDGHGLEDHPSMAVADLMTIRE